MFVRSLHRSGFTLLEMLVALAIMGILATGLYTSLHIGFNARKRAEAAIAPTRSGTLALELLYRDVASALPPTGILAGGFVSEDAEAEGSSEDADTLVFFSAVEDAGQAGTGIRKIEFALTSDQDAQGNLLVRRVTANLLAPTVPEPVEEVLCRNVKSLNMRHFDGLAWQDAWDSTTRDNTLPLAVEVTINIQDSDVRQDADEGHAFTRVFLLPCGTMPTNEGVASDLSSSR